MTNTAAETITGERADLLESLAKHRQFLRFPARDLSDEQARTRTTVSELTIGGLIKHVTSVEETWARFIVDGAAAHPDATDPAATSNAWCWRAWSPR